MSCIKDGAFQPVAIPPPPTHFENSLRSSPFLEVGDSRKKIVDYSGSNQAIALGDISKVNYEAPEEAIASIKILAAEAIA
jgi:hypothetical protein